MDYDALVIEEGGFKVELSNRGVKPKKNPNPINPRGEKVICKFEGCNRKTKSRFAMCSKHSKERVQHTKDWIGRIIPPGYDRDACLTDALPHYRITEILVKWMGDDEANRRVMDLFVDDVLKSLVSNIPHSTALQDSLEGKLKGVMTPDGLVEFTQKIVDRNFPTNKFGDVKLPGGKYRDKKKATKSLDRIPIRAAAALLVLSFACEEANRGDAWYCRRHPELGESRYGNAYMPSVYYFLRRYTGATEKQARMCLKG